MNKTTVKIKAVLETAECLYDFVSIEQALDRMAIAITQKLKDKNPLIICVMTGAVVPMGHLMTRLDFPLEIDYIHVTRYRGTTRGGDLHWLVEPRCDLKNRSVLVIDDILDGGLTLQAILDYCHQAGAREVLSGVMINKRRPRESGVNFEPDFIGLVTDDRYLIGFGLDYHGYWRNLPGIYAVANEHQ